MHKLVLTGWPPVSTFSPWHCCCKGATSASCAFRLCCSTDCFIVQKLQVLQSPWEVFHLWLPSEMFIRCRVYPNCIRWLWDQKYNQNIASKICFALMMTRTNKSMGKNIIINNKIKPFDLFRSAKDLYGGDLGCSKCRLCPRGSIYRIWRKYNMLCFH